jgi:hypothetical protein
MLLCDGIAGAQEIDNKGHCNRQTLHSGSPSSDALLFTDATASCMSHRCISSSERRGDANKRHDLPQRC